MSPFQRSQTLNIRHSQSLLRRRLTNCSVHACSRFVSKEAAEGGRSADGASGVRPEADGDGRRGLQSGLAAAGTAGSPIEMPPSESAKRAQQFHITSPHRKGCLWSRIRSCSTPTTFPALRRSSRRAGWRLRRATAERPPNRPGKRNPSERVLRSSGEGLHRDRK